MPFSNTPPAFRKKIRSRAACPRGLNAKSVPRRGPPSSHNTPEHTTVPHPPSSHVCSYAPTFNGVELMPQSHLGNVRLRIANRQCVRAAKEMDSKSIGLCPQGFESPRCRFVDSLDKQVSNKQASRQTHKQACHATSKQSSKQASRQANKHTQRQLHIVMIHIMHGCKLRGRELNPGLPRDRRKY